MFLKIFINNLLISIFGLGSGTVFLEYVYALYVTTGIITEESYYMYSAITESLPGATSVKILTLIAYDNLNLLNMIIVILIFILPTMIIVVGTFKLFENIKYKNIINNVGVLFTPVLTALILFLTIKFINKNISTVNDSMILILLVICTYIFMEKIKIKNYGLIIILNAIIFFTINLI